MEEKSNTPKEDLSFEEAKKKKMEEEGDAIRKLNNALKLTKNMAMVAGAYYIELRAQGVPEDSARALTHMYVQHLVERS